MLCPLLLYSALLAQEPEPVPASSNTVDQQVAAEAAAIGDAVLAWTFKQSKLKQTEGAEGRLHIWSDFAAGEAKEAAKRSAGLLDRLDRALGAPEPQERTELTGLMLRDPALYRELCGVIAAAAPSQAAFMERSLGTAGFTIYAPPLTVYFHDPKSQDEARPDHSLAHNFTHLELWRRHGTLPLWLTEGLACAGEDGAWGEVWAYWNRKGFVAAKSHSEWRGKKTQTLVKELMNLRPILMYSAEPFDEDLALLSFAFATYGLDAEPEKFGAFLRLLEGAYQANHPQGGRFELPPEEYERLLNQAFGEDFLARFQLWWLKPPKWNAKRI
jgi:hypothetical protein